MDIPPGADPLAWLFAEDSSRILLSIPGNFLADAKRLAGEYNIATEIIGTTGGTTLSVSQGGQVLFDIPVASLRLPYETGFVEAVET